MPLDISTPEKRFAIVNGYIGNGSPSARTWFVGIEEGEAWGPNWEDPEQRRLYELYSQRFGFSSARQLETERKRKGTAFGDVYDIISKVLVPSLSLKLSWRDYEFTRLFQ